MKTKEDPKPFTDERFREYQEKDIRTTGKMLKFFKAIREAIIFSEHKKRYRSIGSGTVPSRKRLIVLKERKAACQGSYYNQKYDLQGHLFQDRFRSEAVDTQAYFLDVLRYICQNPVKAGLSKTPMDYRWLRCSGLRHDSITDSLEEYTHLTGKELQSFLNEPCKEEHLDENACRLTDRIAIGRLCAACECSNVQEIGGWPEKRQLEAIRAGRKAGISIRQLSRLTGISKARIERVR